MILCYSKIKKVKHCEILLIQTGTMLTEERRNSILQKINENQFVEVNDLAAEFVFANTAEQYLPNLV